MALRPVLVGAWLMVDVLHVVLAPELSLAGIPVLSAILGAARRSYSPSRDLASLSRLLVREC